MLSKHPMKTILFIALTIALILSIFSPIAQSDTYHIFADTRTLYTVPNFWNVFSNLPFLFVGIYALQRMFKHSIMCYNIQTKSAYVIFFGAISLVAFGSGYYHCEPNHDTLIWDRLPMSIAFMALFSIVIGEFIGGKEAKMALYPLVILGISSVVYWAYTESIGNGDLRFYIFVQFFPLIIIPLLLLKFHSEFTLPEAYWYLLGTYIFAKIFEYYDAEIYTLLGFISGHSLKHLVAGLGLFILVQSFISRQFVCDIKKENR